MKFMARTYGKSYGLDLKHGPESPAKSLVRMGRLELPRPCERWNLNPVRLPIPPHPHARTIDRLAARQLLRKRNTRPKRHFNFQVALPARAGAARGPDESRHK